MALSGSYEQLLHTTLLTLPEQERQNLLDRPGELHELQREEEDIVQPATIRSDAFLFEERVGRNGGGGGPGFIHVEGQTFESNLLQLKKLLRIFQKCLLLRQCKATGAAADDAPCT
jgi:hypothetical protein